MLFYQFPSWSSAFISFIISAVSLRNLHFSSFSPTLLDHVQSVDELIQAFLISATAFLISGISSRFFLSIFISLLTLFICSCTLSTFPIRISQLFQIPGLIVAISLPCLSFGSDSFSLFTLCFFFQ